MEEPFEIYPYKRMEEPDEKAMGRQEIRRQILWLWRHWTRPRAILCMMIAFLLGRAVVAEQIAPFGLAFLAAVLGRYRPLVFPVMIGILLGEATIGLDSSFWFNSITYVSLVGAYDVLGKGLRRSIWLGILTGCWAFGVKAGLTMVLYEPVAYDYLRIALEAIIAGALVPPFRLILGAIKQPREDFGRFQEEMGSMFLLVLALLLGLNFSLGGYNVGAILSKYLVMLSAAGGAGWGAAFGVACGLLPGLSHFNGLLLAGLYSVSGMMAGFLKHWGKLGLIVGFLCGNLLYGFYFNDEIILINFLGTSAIAALLLFLTPKTIIKNLNYRLFKPQRDLRSFSGPKEDKLERLATLFNELAENYGQASATDDQEQAWERLLSGVINRVCHDCSLARFCWEKEIYQSYQYLIEWLRILEKTDTEQPIELIPTDFKKRCHRAEELGAAISSLVALEKINGYWEEQRRKERKAMAVQLGGAAKVIAATQQGEQITLPRQRDLEEGILRELEEIGFYPEKLEVWLGKKKGLEIHLELDSCGRSKSVCVEQILDCLGEVIGLPVMLERHHCSGTEIEERCYFRFLAMAGCRPEIGIAQWPRDGHTICGDSVMATGLDQNRWLFILSDGMGSGEAAHQESDGVVRLLEQFLSLDFSLIEAIRMVNDLLLLNQEERFATIDLAILDFYQEKLEFIKIGAVPSLLIQGGKSQLLSSNTLPVGILDDIPIEPISIELQPGAVLIMVTDGIWQGPNDGQKEGWLSSFVQGIWHLAPEELAERIVEHAMIMYGGKAEDDLTALVVRVDKT